MVEAVAERKDADIGTIAGTSVAATAAGVGTFAAGSALANPESRAALQAAAGDKVINIGNSIKDFEGFKFGKEKAQETAQQLSLDLGETKEAGKGIFGNIKDKAGEIGDSLKGFLGDAKNNFNQLDGKTKAGIIIGTTLATLAVAKVTHDKMTEPTIDPQQAQIANVSQGVQMGRSSQLQV